MIDISKELRNLRVKNDYTQGEIAELCGVSRQAVAKWEAGINLPDIEKIVQLSKIYHVSTDKLLIEQNAVTDNSDNTKQTDWRIENEKIINQALENSMNCKNPDEGINNFISYIGEQIDSDRIYIFETNLDGSFRNTYEWCNRGVKSQKVYLQYVPIKDISSWIKTFSSAGHVFIENLEDIAETEPEVYRWLKPQGIKTLLAYPLFGGRNFIGVDNPAPAFISQTANLMEIMLHFLENIIERRNLVNELKFTAFQNNQITSLNKAISYRVNLVTGQIDLNEELAAKAGCYFKSGTVDEVKKLSEQHKEFYDHAMIDGFEKAIETKENATVEFISYKDDKYLRWNRLTISPFVDSEGKVLQLYGFLQDVSESHQFIEQYNKYILSLSGGFHICHLSRPVHLEYASDNLCSFLGYTREEFDRIVDFKYTNIMVEEDRPVFCAYFKRLTENIGIESCKYRLIKKDGTTVSVIDTMESYIDGSGLVYGYAFVLPETEMHTLLEMKEENEKKHMALLNQQYAVFETLGKEYPDVYRVWLDENKAQIIRLDGYITKGLKKDCSEFIPYYRTCKQYVMDRVHPDDQQKMLEATHPDTVRKAFEQSDEYTVIYRALDNGKTHYFQMVYSRLYDTKDKTKINFIAGFKNVDKFIEAEHANDKKLQGEIAIINTILKAFTCGYYMEYATDSFVELSNTDERLSKLIGKSGHFSENRERMKNAFPDKKAFREIDDFLNADTIRERIGKKRCATAQVGIKGYGWYEMHMFIVDYDENGKIAHSILLAKDITEERNHEIEFKQEALHAAYLDALTGVMNRNAYERDFNSMNNHLQVGFIYCDVNNLKQTNDSQGHGSGDRLLVNFSKLLHKFVSSDCIYRIGGDEFVCMIKNIEEQRFEERVTKITEAIAENNSIASIGSAYGTASHKEKLIREAEIQMYAMKLREHRNRK